MKILHSVIVIFFVFKAQAQVANPFYVGHSLVNHFMPYLVQKLAVDADKKTQYGVQIINGSPLQFNYANAKTAEGTPYTTAFPNGNFNTLVVTEAVPLQNHLTWSDTYGSANKFYQFAKNNNNGVATKFYIYETWHCINSGIPNTDPNLPNGCWYDQTANSTILWHQRLLTDFSLWSGIVSYVRNQNPADKQIWMIPAGQAFHHLTTQINAGNVPGLRSFRDLFSDDIHLTNAGNYFVACVIYATIYGESPVGLTSNILDQWGNAIPNLPTPAQALIMQQVAWNTVTNLSTWTGVSSVLLNAENTQLSSFTIRPNPSSDFISINIDNRYRNNIVQIYNSIGVLVKEVLLNDSSTIQISDLTSGMYFMNIKNSSLGFQKFIKE
jgi:hypothetical protein